MLNLKQGRELTLRECDILLRLDGTTESAVEGWEFDYTKIDRALDFLKIYHPVRLGLKTGIYKLGHHDSRNNMHEIRISTYEEIEEANDSLWHELAHAMQSERLWREEGIPIWQFGEIYNDNMGPSGSMYRNNYFEIEAREIAEKYGKLALLA